jgi:hypothetical protein
LSNFISFLIFLFQIHFTIHDYLDPEWFFQIPILFRIWLDLQHLSWLQSEQPQIQQNVTSHLFLLMLFILMQNWIQPSTFIQIWILLMKMVWCRSKLTQIQREFGMDIPDGDGNIANFYLQCCYVVCLITFCLAPFKIWCKNYFYCVRASLYLGLHCFWFL